MATHTRKPYWLTESCPSWCESLHKDADAVGDRAHFGGPYDQVLMTLAEGRAVGDVVIEPTCSVYVEQRVRESAPRFGVEWAGVRAEFTAAEARQLADLLLAALQMTEDPTP